MNHDAMVPALTREREALAWLYSLADQERGVGWNPAANPAEQWKLGRTRALLDLAGAPDRQMTCVLIAGTKGKGSTAAMLASVLAALGVRAGLYTKPHLQNYRERVRVDGRMITAGAFADAVGRARRVVDALRQRYPDAGEPTTFEVTTTLALDHFARQGCQVAVVEVGLGGRLDATNTLDPAVSIITSISRDHTAILGTTLGAIAGEKAGILRKGRTALLAQQRPAAARALAHSCRKSGAHRQTVPPLEPVEDGQQVRLPGGSLARMALLGEQQRQNAALAVAAARLLTDCGDAPFTAAVAMGLERLNWPGRFEVVPGTPPVILDGAHNDASAAALASTLAGFANDQPIHLVLGINRDKEATAVLRPLLPLAAAVWVTASKSARALPPKALAAQCRRLTAVPVHVAHSVPEAVTAAAGALCCVTGSMAVVGEARDALGLPPVEQLWKE